MTNTTNRSRKPSVSIEIITPEIAQDWLTFNRHNRKPKSDRVAKYARDMANGRWIITGEAIRFDVNGWLLDGQNRLMACVQANVHFESYVIRNLDAEAQVVMDSGAPRRPADALTMKGYGHGKDLAACVVVHRAWTRGDLVSVMSHLPSDRATHIEVVEYVGENPELITATEFALRQKSRMRGVPVGAVAVAFDEFRKIGPDEALDYFDRIRDGRSTGTGDPILTLMRRIQDETGPGRRLTPATALFLFFRSWNAIRSGERLVKFQYGSDERGWVSIPEPK